MQTHCCFCGQQCGIHLKVKDNEVIGFEPWEEFPFNRGMLCPKGVKRYLQGSHPDRLTDRASPRHVARRPASARCRTRRRSRRVASEIERLQRTHGTVVGRRARRREPDDREDLPARQVRPRLPADAVHRLQRPPVHGQRRRREQEGVRHRSDHQPVVGHGRDRRDLGRGLERRRVLADHDQLHLAGARAGREGHRRRIRASRRSRGPATCILPVKPGRDAALFAGVLQPDDRARLDRPRRSSTRTPSASIRWRRTVANGRRRGRRK